MGRSLNYHAPRVRRHEPVTFPNRVEDLPLNDGVQGSPAEIIGGGTTLPITHCKQPGFSCGVSLVGHFPLGLDSLDE